MTVSEIKDKSVWQDFLLSCENKTFLQAWNYGEFQKEMGSKIWRLGVYDNNKLISAALVVKVIAKRGIFLLLPHCPVGICSKQILEALLVELKKIAKEEKSAFIRINPICERIEENIEIFKKLGFKSASMHSHPEASWKLDIQLSEEELLTNMRKTTRYLIRQAQKNNDIEISQSTNLKDVETFNELYQEVVKIQHFVPFSLDYLKKEFSAFKNDNEISLFFGKYQGKVVAAAFVLFWSNIGFYHHAALLPEYHKIPVSYLLQWEVIKEAKKRGCKLYDFWGYVDPKSNHPWAGPTLFKMGFGGNTHLYVKTQDMPLSIKYWPTYAFEKLRKTKRGL